MALKPDIDAIILRQLYLDRYGYGYASDMTNAVKIIDIRVVNLIRDFFSDANGRDIQALLRQNRRNDTVRRFLDGLDNLIGIASLDSVSRAVSEMESLAESMVNHTYASFGSTATERPAASQIIRSAVIGIGIGQAWKELYERHQSNVLKSVINSVQMDREPVAAIRGTRSQRYKDGLINTRNNHIRSLSTTQAYGVAGNSRSESYRRLGVKQEVIVSTLDFRTTFYCRSVDGDVWDVEDGPHPPFHWRCRTLRVPFTGTAEERPYVKSSDPVSKIPRKPESIRKSKIGITTDNYQTFFDRLNPSQQEEVLGSERYKRYASGKVGSMKEFVEPESGRTYTIKELDELY